MFRNDSRAEKESWRATTMRWLAAAFVMIMVGFATAPGADAHTSPQPAAQHEAGFPHHVSAGSNDCCAAAEAAHDGETCSAFGHCIGCTIGSASASMPGDAPAARYGLRLMALPAGLLSGPAGHPPKSSLKV